MAGKLVKIKGKITNQKSKQYANGKKTFYILSVLKDDGQTRKVSTYQSEHKLKDHYVEIIAEHSKGGDEGQFDNYKLKSIKEQKDRASEEPITDEEEIVSDDGEEVIEDDSGTPAPKNEIKETLNTESGAELDPDTPSNEDKAKWDKINRRDTRSICLSYIKDLIIADKIALKDAPTETKKFFDYVWGKDE